MYYVKFTLSMPRNNAWNNKWSGSQKNYCVVRSFTSQERADNLEGYYSYNFGDGWMAGISVKTITKNEAKTIQDKTDGFCGYDWMVDSIIEYGDIRVSDKRSSIGIL